MTRKSLPLLLVGLVTGCASTFVTPKPLDLEDRLTRIEEVRLPPPSAGAMRPWAVPERALAHVQVNRPPALVEQLGMASPVRREWSDALDTMTLGDMGEQATAQDARATDERLSLSTEKEEKYLRRPPLKSFWETAKRDIKAVPADLWRDTKRVYANPVNLVILGSAYGGSLALQESRADERVEHHFNRNNDFEPAHHHFKEDWRDAFGAMGNPATHFALAGAWYLLGQQTMDDKTYEVGKTLFSALLINGVTVVVGQAASADRAPNGEYGTFPSGHTSSSFVFASVMHEAYGHLVGIPLYGLATLVGMERIEDGEHYLSDVVMGAVMGTVIGHSVASGRDPEFFGWKVLPYADPQSGAGIAFMKSIE